EHQKAYLDSVSQVYVLTKRQYEQGYSDYLSLLDAKRNYLAAQLSLVQTKQSLISSGISLYKALGGGFDKQAFEKETSEL
ncbi:MAG: RND transporter, partial [Epsilonproteobacteria bacterium]|nr:RND transporter [Campylobacterota bacterium]